ncbi:amidohydrolase [Shimia sp. SDUM112013]|uniref:amidohydrolase n=1 Tax=Shimia sp. SDUM112013 TaxID=3136160 RepID=UPI0032EAD36B
MSDFVENLVALRHDLHRHPELGFQEHRTKQVVAKRLRALGIEVHEGAGVVGVLRRGAGNRAIGLRADMDALAISETSTHDYVSTAPGVMHACGHDGHTTMLLGAAERLTREGDFDGTVVFLFQPDEEHGGGARAMIDEGVLQRFEVDEVYAIHNLPGAPLGQVSSRTGMICSSESLFTFTIDGRGGHSSMPHVGAEALTVGAELVLALQTIVSRKLPPDAGVVVSPTEFTTNGQRNVLPGQAVIKGDVRARAPEQRAAVEGFMRQIAAGLATAHGVSIDVAFQTDFVETFNAETPTEAVYRAGVAARCDVWRERPAMSFSEDFAQFTAAVPGCFLLMGNGEEGANGQPLHSSDYDFNDALLPIGAEFWVQLVRDRLPHRKDAG